MADIQCPSCEKNNPGFLDVCQFCQTPLTPDSMVHIGDKPTKKNTSELEPILPEWLRDVRQQARESMEEGELPPSATQPRVQKNEAPDLLAGLASQKGDDEEDIPDWLKSINPVTKPKESEPSTPAPANDFFAQFSESKAPPAPSQPKAEEPEEEIPSWMSGLSQPQEPAEKDELSEWFTHTSEETGRPAPAEPSAPAEEKEDLSWLRELEASAKKSEELSAPKQDAGWDFGTPPASFEPSTSQDDLNWLNTLGGSSESAPPQAQEDLGWLKDFEKSAEQPVAPSSAPEENLDWLNALGGAAEPAQPFPESTEKDDLRWLDTLGGAAEPAQPTPSAPPAKGGTGDLSWLDALSETAEPVQPASATPAAQDDAQPAQPEPVQPSASNELDWLKEFAASTSAESTQSEPEQAVSSSGDLDWLSSLGASQGSQPEAAEPSPQQDDLSWLNDLAATSAPPSPSYAKPFGATDELTPPPPPQDEQGVPHVSPFVPRRTAPLGETSADDTMPDWLKSATEEKPILPLGASALEQIRETSHKPADESTPPSAPGSAPDDWGVFSAPAESPALTNQDVDSLFSMEMPDWLSKPQPEMSETPGQKVEIVSSDGSLAPVELPSWVQAMRPVEAVLAETGASGTETQPVEKEGPLAGLRGVIPFAPIGSSRRPKAFSLKLQATDEQQAGASLLDQILAGETQPRPVAQASAFTSQNVLRWSIAGLLWVILGAILFLRSQWMPVSPFLPPAVSAVSEAVTSLPERSPVLVVIDYEPSLAGEMEAVSGPLLDQLVLAKAPRLAFLSTSPTSSALVERLLARANINESLADGGLGYVAGQNYSNLGYLPGGSTGILGFVSQPEKFIPSETLQVTKFSEYAAVILLTDNADSGRSWVEQLDTAKQADPALAAQTLVLVTSAQAGPLLQPYVDSGQAAGMINGLVDGARYEYVNGSRPGTARTYWDAFSVGIFLAITLIVLGGVWGLMTGIRARRVNSGQG